MSRPIASIVTLLLVVVLVQPSLACVGLYRRHRKVCIQN